MSRLGIFLACAVIMVTNAQGRLGERRINVEIDIVRESSPCLISRGSLPLMGGNIAFPIREIVNPNDWIYSVAVE